MLRFDTYTRMREYSTVNEFGVGTPAVFRNSTFGWGAAIWMEVTEDITPEGAPMSLYHATGTPDGTAKFTFGTGIPQVGTIGPCAYNGTLAAATAIAADLALGKVTRYYLWVQISGLSSASLQFTGATAINDMIWPSSTAGNWDNFATIKVNVDLTATTYVWNLAPYGYLMVGDTSTLFTAAAGTAVISSPWWKAYTI